MSDAAVNALRTAACIAFRHIHEVSENEREQVLVALIEALPAREGKLAEGTLYHLREQRRLQLELAGILDRQHAQALNKPANDGSGNP